MSIDLLVILRSGTCFVAAARGSPNDSHEDASKQRLLIGGTRARLRLLLPAIKSSSCTFSCILSSKARYQFPQAQLKMGCRSNTFALSQMMHAIFHDIKIAPITIRGASSRRKMPLRKRGYRCRVAPSSNHPQVEARYPNGSLAGCRGGGTL